MMAMMKKMTMTIVAAPVIDGDGTGDNDHEEEDDGERCLGEQSLGHSLSEGRPSLFGCRCTLPFWPHA